MPSLKEKALKIVEEKEAASKPAVSPFPTTLPVVNPILKMALEQAEQRRTIDEYHGFK